VILEMFQENISTDDNPILSAMLENKRRLITIAERVLQSKLQAEDIFHDAVVKVCGMRTGCIHCPMGYACRMIHNLALDEVRKRQSERRKLVPLDDIDTIPAAGVDALDCMIGAEALERVLSCLHDLPRRTHDAFLRHRVEGVPQKEIAAELGVSTTLVNFMIRDAHRHCRARFNSA
jgi:RNA polymerase sigma-70 factor, ECF subfamily